MWGVGPQGRGATTSAAESGGEPRPVEGTSRGGVEGEGVASFVVVDPDGNPILIDQHVPKPG